MKTTTPHPVLVRLLPSLTDVAFMLPILFVFGRGGGARFLLGDGDTGWHIRAGDWMLANGRVADRDMFSFTRPGEPWHAWEWFSEIGMSLLHAWGGLPLLVLASLALICLTYALLFRQVRRESGSPLLAIALTAVAAGGGSVHWLARPHLVTLLLVVVCLNILRAAQRGETRKLWWLPAITVAWVQAHGGFLAGMMLIGAFCAGELLAAVLMPVAGARMAALRRAVPFALAGLGCAAASFVNPFTWRLHAHIIEYLRDPFHRENIGEFLSVNFHHPAAVYIEPMAALATVALVWSLKQRRFTDAVLLAMWIHLGLGFVRNVPILLIVAAAPVGKSLAEWLQLARRADVARWLRRAADRFLAKSAEVATNDDLPRWHIASAAALAGLGALLLAPAPPRKFDSSFNPSDYPEKAIRATSGLRGFGKVFTTDEWGDYLIYRLYPEGKVFIDGRSDFYGPKFGTRYLDVIKVRWDWEKVLQQYGVESVLLPADAPLAGAMKESHRWRAAYDDGVAILFRRPAAMPDSGRDPVSAVAMNGGRARGYKAAETTTTQLD